MKKLFLIAAASTVFLFSAISFADENQPADTMKTNPNERRFYLKVEGGVSKLSATKSAEPNNFSITSTFKSKTNATSIFGVGVGYYCMENGRVELTLDVLASPESKDFFTASAYSLEKQATANVTARRKANVMSLLFSGYVDSPKVGGIFQFFVGSGIGLAYIKEKFDANLVSTSKETLYVWNRETVENPTNSTTLNVEDTASSTNVACQLVAGVSADIANGVKLEIAYSWKNYGAVVYKEMSASEIGYAYGLNKVILGHTYRGHNIMAGIRFDI
ncbi:outer membrane protein [Candidatus Tisiphia endosymbiont of Hybos culiciformis]|uniref:outer membrane protein n=1 Tax=Candidatus Tisiphia endosymbiont of Hybos culiciformis TaxID=3139331 RepID=UPI003CCB4561